MQDFEEYRQKNCKGWSYPKAMKQWQRYVEDEMKTMKELMPLAKMDFCVAERSAAGTHEHVADFAFKLVSAGGREYVAVVPSVNFFEFT